MAPGVAPGAIAGVIDASSSDVSSDVSVPGIAAAGALGIALCTPVGEPGTAGFCIAPGIAACAGSIGLFGWLALYICTNASDFFCDSALIRSVAVVESSLSLAAAIINFHAAVPFFRPMAAL